MFFLVNGWRKLEYIKIKKAHTLILSLNFQGLFWCRSIYCSFQVAASKAFGQETVFRSAQLTSWA